MNLGQDMELGVRDVRKWAVVFFTIISAALWIGFSVDTYFSGDGCFYFTIILGKEGFTNISPSRVHAEFLSQWPLVWAVKAGITNLAVLEVFFGLGLWFPWLLGFALSLYATRERPSLVFFYLISLASLNLAGWCLLYGEHMVLLSLAWPIFFLGILRRSFTRLEQVLVLGLLVIHMRLYETAVVSGTIFTVIFAFRAWLGKSPSERWGNVLFMGLALASVFIALGSIVFPRDLSNRGHFLKAIVDSLGHPYPWMGLFFVVCKVWGSIFSSKKILTAGWVLPLSIGILSLFTGGIMSGISFSTRALTLTVLPILMVCAGVVSLSRFSFRKGCLLSVLALVCGLSILHLRHLERWVDFRAEFKEILKTERGIVKPVDHDNINHWGWTNGILSYVWSEGEVEAIIVNTREEGYEPFLAREEVLIGKYLTKKPDFLEAPAEEKGE